MIALLFALASVASADPVYDHSQVFDVPEGPNGSWIDHSAFDIVPLRPADPTSTAIVNGTVATGHNNVVALAALDTFGGYVFCSGTLVDPSWVVTAAHCVVDIPDLRSQGWDVVVLWGNDLMNVGFSDAIDVSQHYAHGSYNAAALRNDIALVELVSPKTGVDLAVLNDEAVDNSWIGTDMRFYGFGVTVDDGYDSGVKRTTDITVDGFDTYFITSYTPGTNLCQGDSGGPAFELVGGNMELAGINSYVSPQCVGGSNGVTRVDQYIDWIRGYAPNVITSGSGAGSNPGGGGGEGGGGGDEFVVPDSADSDDIDRDFGAVSNSTDGQYRTGIRCNTGAVSGGSTGGFLVLLTPLILGLRRRRA